MAQIAGSDSNAGDFNEKLDAPLNSVKAILTDALTSFTSLKERLSAGEDPKKLLEMPLVHDFQA